MDNITGELISGNLALSRIGCAELCEDRFDHILVEWRGFPVAFACGDTIKHGEHKERRRVSRHSCGGKVLFSFPRVGLSYPNGDRTKEPSRYYLQSDLCVSVETSTCDTYLRAAVSA